MNFSSQWVNWHYMATRCQQNCTNKKTNFSLVEIQGNNIGFVYLKFEVSKIF